MNAPADFDARLREAARQVDVLDLAGAIIANPHRAMVSQAGKLAMAMALERTWEVCLEANLLVRALALRTDSFTTEAQFDVRDHAITSQAARIVELMAALCAPMAPAETTTETKE